MATVTYAPQTNLNSKTQAATITIDNNDKEYVINSSDVDLVRQNLDNTHALPSKRVLGLEIVNQENGLQGLIIRF